MKGLGASSAWRISEMQMSNQNAKFVSAVFAGVLAGANFIPALNNSARAEDSCLTTPNGQTPAGSHWYYRIEHGTKRHCWYLREAGDAHSQSAAATSTSSPAADPSPAASSPPPALAKPKPAKADAAVQGSVANAHAELPWPQPRTTPAITPAPATAAPAAAAPATPAAAPATPASTEQVPTAAPTNALSSNSPQPSPSISSAAAAADTSQATVSARWPDQLHASASDDLAPVADDSDTNAQPDTALAPPPPPAAAVPLATADAAPPSSKQPGSMQALLTIMIAALALAGLVAGAILRFGRRKDDEVEVDLDRRPVWDREYGDRPLSYPAAATQRPNIGRPRELRTVEPDDTIKEMLARLARSAQT